MKNKANDKGFTLVEVIVVLVIVGLILPPFLSMFYRAVNSTQDSRYHLKATYIAQDKVEEITGIKTEVVGVDGIKVYPRKTTLLNTDGTVKAAYNPTLSVPYEKDNMFQYRRTLALTDPDPAKNTLLKLTVEVTWKSTSGTSQSYKVVTLIATQ